MDNMSAFARGAANRNKPLMVFDWNKAIDLINEHNLKDAYAGLEDDYEYTAGQILQDGKPFRDDYTYLSSTWAKPQLFTGDHELVFDCYVMEHETEWNCNTKFPVELESKLYKKSWEND